MDVDVDADADAIVDLVWARLVWRRERWCSIAWVMGSLWVVVVMMVGEAGAAVGVATVIVAVAVAVGMRVERDARLASIRWVSGSSILWGDLMIGFLVDVELEFEFELELELELDADGWLAMRFMRCRNAARLDIGTPTRWGESGDASSAARRHVEGVVVMVGFAVEAFPFGGLRFQKSCCFIMVLLTICKLILARLCR